MLKIGLTGSIGMGKTTTAKMFQSFGCPVFDADAVVHGLYAKGGQAVPLIRSVFPDAMANGSVNRKVLGKHMRADPLNLQILESFIHPMVADMRAAFLESAVKNKSEIVVFDVPLLFETGGEAYVDKIVVVTASAQTQRDRVLARPDMTVELFESLLSRQTPDSEKRKKADFLIFTDKGLDNAREQVQSILTALRTSSLMSSGAV